MLLNSSYTKPKAFNYYEFKGLFYSINRFSREQVNYFANLRTQSLINSLFREAN